MDRKTEIQLDVVLRGREVLKDLKADVRTTETAIQEMNRQFQRGTIDQANFDAGAKSLIASLRQVKSEASLASSSLQGMGGGFRISGSAGTQLAYVLDDMQYGLRGISNNVAPILTAFGVGGAWVLGAQVLTTTLTAMQPVLMRLWESFQPEKVDLTTSAVDRLKTKIKELEDKKVKLYIDVVDLDNAKKKLEEIEKINARIKGFEEKVPKAQEQHGRAIEEALARDFPGSSLIDRITAEKKRTGEYSQVSSPEIAEREREKRDREEVLARIKSGKAAPQLGAGSEERIKELENEIAVLRKDLFEKRIRSKVADALIGGDEGIKFLKEQAYLFSKPAAPPVPPVAPAVPPPSVTSPVAPPGVAPPIALPPAAPAPVAPAPVAPVAPAPVAPVAPVAPGPADPHATMLKGEYELQNKLAKAEREKQDKIAEAAKKAAYERAKLAAEHPPEPDLATVLASPSPEKRKQDFELAEKQAKIVHDEAEAVRKAEKEAQEKVAEAKKKAIEDSIKLTDDLNKAGQEGEQKLREEVAKHAGEELKKIYGDSYDRLVMRALASGDDLRRTVKQGEDDVRTALVKIAPILGTMPTTLSGLVKQFSHDAIAKSQDEIQRFVRENNVTLDQAKTHFALLLQDRKEDQETRAAKEEFEKYSLDQYNRQRAMQPDLPQMTAQQRKQAGEAMSEQFTGLGISPAKQADIGRGLNLPRAHGQVDAVLDELRSQLEDERAALEALPDVLGRLAAGQGWATALTAAINTAWQRRAAQLQGAEAAQGQEAADRISGGPLMGPPRRKKEPRTLIDVLMQQEQEPAARAPGAPAPPPGAEPAGATSSTAAPAAPIASEPAAAPAAAPAATPAATPAAVPPTASAPPTPGATTMGGNPVGDLLNLAQMGAMPSPPPPPPIEETPTAATPTAAPVSPPSPQEALAANVRRREEREAAERARLFPPPETEPQRLAREAKRREDLTPWAPPPVAPAAPAAASAPAGPIPPLTGPSVVPVPAPAPPPPPPPPAPGELPDADADNVPPEGAPIPGAPKFTAQRKANYDADMRRVAAEGELQRAQQAGDQGAVAAAQQKVEAARQQQRAGMEKAATPDAKPKSHSQKVREGRAKNIAARQHKQAQHKQQRDFQAAIKPFRVATNKKLKREIARNTPPTVRTPEEVESSRDEAEQKRASYLDNVRAANEEEGVPAPDTRTAKEKRDRYLGNVRAVNEDEGVPAPDTRPAAKKRKDYLSNVRAANEEQGAPAPDTRSAKEKRDRYLELVRDRNESDRQDQGFSRPEPRRQSPAAAAGPADSHAANAIKEQGSQVVTTMQAGAQALAAMTAAVQTNAQQLAQLRAQYNRIAQAASATSATALSRGYTS